MRNTFIQGCTMYKEKRDVLKRYMCMIGFEPLTLRLRICNRLCNVYIHTNRLTVDTSPNFFRDRAFSAVQW